MKQIYFWSQLILLIIIVSCGQKRNSYPELNTEELVGTKLLTDSLFSRCNPILLKDSVMVMLSYDPEYVMCVGTIKGDSLTTRQNIFKKGNGPNEYYGCEANFSADSNIIVYNFNGGGLVSDMKKIPYPTVPPTDITLARYESTSLIPVSLPQHFTAINDSLLLMPTSEYHKSYILSTFNLNSQEIRPLHFWPDDAYNGPHLPKQCIYSDNCHLYGNGEHFLYECGEERYAFIFTIQNDSVCIIRELFNDKPDFKEDVDGFNYNLTRHGKGLQISVTQNMIYCLLLPATNNNGSFSVNGFPTEGNIVLVFDWNGEPLRKLKLDQIGNSIKIDQNDKNLYLFSDNSLQDGDAVWRYAMQ